MSTVLGCPWETHERQPCKLLEYTGTPSVHIASLCWQEGEVTGKQSACRSITWGQGNTLKPEDTRDRGNRRHWNIPLVDIYGYIFPETPQDRKPLFENDFYWY